MTTAPLRELHDGLPVYLRGSSWSRCARDLASKKPRAAVDRQSLQSFHALAPLAAHATSFEGVSRGLVWRNHGDLVWDLPQIEKVATGTHSERCWIALCHFIAGLKTSRLAVQLSGGIDSCVVAAAAREASSQAGMKAPLMIHRAYGGLACDETDFSTEASRALGCELLSLDAMRFGFVESLDEWMSRADDPFLEFHEAATREMYRRAAEKGCDIVLTGIGGDEVFQGRDYDAELMRKGRVLESLSVAKGLARLTGAKVGVRRAAGVMKRAVMRSSPGARQWVRKTLMGGDLVWRLDYGARRASSVGVRVVHPLLSRAFLDVLLAAPAEVVWGGGDSKPTARRMVQNRLPARIVRRELKASNVEAWRTVLAREEASIRRRFPANSTLNGSLELALRGKGRLLKFWLPFLASEFEFQWNSPKSLL